MSEKSRAALVIGGGTGIGAAVCDRLAEIGVGRIAVNYSKSADAAQQVVDRLNARGVEAFAVQADVSDEASICSMMADVRQKFGRLDYLSFNAGITEAIPFADLDKISDEIWDRLFDTNLKGAFWCARAAAPLLKESSGAIVNMVGLTAHRAIGSSIPYSVSKAGLLHLTRDLAIALAPQVRVNSVSTGTVKSGWHERLVGAEVFAARAAAEAPTVPLGRLAEPEDVAEGIVALLTLKFVTGQDLVIDGGKALKY